MKIPTGKLNRLLLGILLIAAGALALVPDIKFAGSGTLLAVLAVATGILILMDR